MNIALLTAAGNATRMHQDIPKQFMHVEDKPIIVHTMQAFQNHPSIDAIIVVTLEAWMSVLWAYAKQFGIDKLKWVVPGGETGQDSIWNGICKVAESVEDPEQTIVTIHDGNRPMVSTEIISNNLAVFKEHGNAVTAIPCQEVVFESEDGISSHVSTEREKLFRTQTPHTYYLKDVIDAHEQARQKGIAGTAATCMLMKELGKETYFSKGSEINLKITTLDDLKIFKALLHTRHDDWIKE